MARLALPLLLLLLAAAPARAAPDEAGGGSAPDDDALRERLERIYGDEALPGYANVKARVVGGVVILEGEVPDAEHVAGAGTIAAGQEGVVAVENRLEPTSRVEERLTPVLQRLRTRGQTLLRRLPLYGVALVLFLVAWFLARWISGWNWLFSRIARNHFTRDLVRGLARALIVLGGILLVLEILDATALVGAVLGTAGVVGLAIGFAFRDLIENYLASILLSLKSPFLPGDHVLIGEHEGKVALLTSRSTILRTLDGNHLRILNADVYKARILNYSRNPRRRFEFDVGLGTEEDLVAARQLGLATLGSMRGVLDDPPPQVLVHALGDSSVVLRHYGWVDQHEADFLKVRGEAIRLVKRAYDAAGFDLPEPIHRVRLRRVEHPFREEDGEPGSPAEPGTVQDIAPDRHLDEEIAAERRATRATDLMATTRSELPPAEAPPKEERPGP